jgi:uncharacterized protein YjbJ (UPF0337 family)
MSQQLKLEAPWEQVKEQLKEANTKLTDDDLVYAPGQEDQLLERVALRTGSTKEEAKGWIESVSANKGKAS